MTACLVHPQDWTCRLHESVSSVGPSSLVPCAVPSMALETPKTCMAVTPVTFGPPLTNLNQVAELGKLELPLSASGSCCESEKGKFAHDASSELMECAANTASCPTPADMGIAGATPAADRTDDRAVSPDTASQEQMQVEDSSDECNESLTTLDGSSDVMEAEEASSDEASLAGAGPAPCQLAPAECLGRLDLDDLLLLVDLFYLPFEHGPQAVHLLEELHWLINHSHVIAEAGKQLPPEVVR